MISLYNIFILAITAVSTAMAALPTVVIVPGSWQLPSVWVEFRAILARAGHPAHHVSLPSVGGTDLPLTGLPEDVAAVRAQLDQLADQGDEIILLCHSSGGVVGANAVEGYDIATRKANGKNGGVIRIVYLSAFMLPKDQSLLGMLGGVPLPWMVVNVSLRPVALGASFVHLLTPPTGRPRHGRPRDDARDRLQRLVG
jgi:pimeloyl-ACP methyl ester carboxylesterase